MHAVPHGSANNYGHSEDSFFPFPLQVTFTLTLICTEPSIFLIQVYRAMILGPLTMVTDRERLRFIVIRLLSIRVVLDMICTVPPVYIAKTTGFGVTSLLLASPKVRGLA